MPDRRWPSAGVRRSGAASARCHPRVTSTATRAGDVLWLALASGCSVARWLGVPPCSRRGVVAVAHVLPCSHAGLPRVRLCGGSSASPLEGCSRARRRAAVARSLARRHAAVAPLRSFVSNHVALSLRTTTLPFRRYHLRPLSHKPLLLGVRSIPVAVALVGRDTCALRGLRTLTCPAT